MGMAKHLRRTTLEVEHLTLYIRKRTKQDVTVTFIDHCPVGDGHGLTSRHRQQRHPAGNVAPPRLLPRCFL